MISLAKNNNIGIGSLQDNPEIIRTAANYVDKWKEIHEPTLPKKYVEGNLIVFKEYKLR